MYSKSVATLLVALALGVGGCGGGSGDQNSSEVTSATSQVTPVDAANAIMALLGPGDAFDAVVYALDAGYSVQQIVTAGLAAELEADGRIPGVEPEGSAYGLVTAPIASSGSVPEDGAAAPLDRHPRVVLAAHRIGMVPALAADDGAHTPREMRSLIGLAMLHDTITLIGAPWTGDLVPNPDVTDESAENTRRLIGVLLGLIDAGYTFDQAVTGALFGDWTMAVGVDTSGRSPMHAEVGGKPISVCLVLTDEEGNVVQPLGTSAAVFPGSEGCRSAIRDGTISFSGDPDEIIALAEGVGEKDDSTTTTTTSKADEGPIVFRGDGWIRTTGFRSADGAEFACTESGPMELVLAPDGTGIFHSIVWVGIDIGEGDAYECVERTGNAYDVVHDAGAGTFTVRAAFAAAYTPSMTPEQRDFSSRMDSWDIGGTWTVDRAEGGGTSVSTATAGDGSAFFRTTVEFSFTLCSSDDGC